MLDFTGVKCPVCGVPFRQEDDIVVCPECGAPYHRECYRQEGKCIFGDLHAQGKDWAPPAPPKAEDPAAEIKDRECSVCGTLNGHSALFCSRCGASLLGEPRQHANTAQPDTEAPTPPPFYPYGGFNGNMRPIPFDPMGGVSPADSLDDGVTFGDASKLVKQNTHYYMPVFRYIRQSGRNKFNFSAFLFSGAWLLYRKQYKSGAVITALVFILYVLHLCLFWTVSYPTLTNLYAQAGIEMTAAAAITGEQYTALYNAMLMDPSCTWKLLAPYLLLGLQLAVMIVVGLRGNRMYLKHCVETTRSLKAEGTDGDMGVLLDARGGVNIPVTACIAIGYFLLRNLLPLLFI